MSGLHSLVANALAAPLAAAREHSVTGASIGYIGGEVPVEVIRASGAFALRLPAAVLAATERANALLESSFMPQIRSIAERHLAGEFDFLQAIVFPRSNDSAQRLYYYLSELERMGRRGPRLLIYDLAKIPRPTSLEHSIAATRQLAQDLQANDDMMKAAVERRNRRVQLVARATQRRLAGAARGSEMERMARAAGYCDPDAFDQTLAAWLDAPEPSMRGPRLLLVGSAPPDERLHRMVEEAGGNVIAELGEHAYYEWRQVTALGSVDEIAGAYHASRFGPRAFADRTADLLELVESARVDGVIFWLVEEEDAFIWDLPAQRAALVEAGIRHVALSRQRWDAAGDTREAILNFVGELSRGRP